MTSNIEKLHQEMQKRYDALHELIWRDFAGNPYLLYERWMEVKYWKELIERDYLKENKVEQT
ncbi:hypothetical protein [Cytobacillus praedii]|uniref:Uncharacterized protein n=1 Tax=Cytobacillus praedii TaxID=1742358 RepID=A0A4R1ARF9_9BACI|nr:hypothetical protein [Cytobacillus praedii]TCJ00013.1 hypothetical protein E0Y62_26990 [Cytobacillus praedii]